MPINYFFKKHYSKAEHKESRNRFDVIADSTWTEEKVQEEIEVNNNSTEEIKEKIMITNDKVKKNHKKQEKNREDGAKYKNKKENGIGEVSKLEK